MTDTIKFLAVTGIEGNHFLINTDDVWAIEEQPDRTIFHMISGSVIRVKESYGMIKEKLSDYVC